MTPLAERTLLLNGSLCNPYQKAGYCPDDLPVMPDDPRYREAAA